MIGPGKRYFFIGIGGIGMSALARYFKAQGHAVAGYDKTASPLTHSLEAEGIPVSYVDDVQQIPSEYTQSIEELVIVRTPAVPMDIAIVQHYLAMNALMVKRAELLAKVSSDKRTLAVAGTHGKTTTSSILGHILYASHTGCNAFVGGVMTGYDRNLLLDPESELVVLEADEFDRSFHRLDPEVAIITSLDPDHLDIYGDEANFHQAFLQFAQRVRGSVFHASDVELPGVQVDTYSYGIDSGDYRATNVRVEEGRFKFDLHTPHSVIEDLVLQLPGRHNVLNATAAIAVCLDQGLSEEEIRTGLATYRGVKRRFEFILRSEALTFIDDYAHHPSEIDAAISAARELFPDKRLTVVFQPHLYSRTRDFMAGFAASLSQADELVLLPIYPARELPIPNVDSQALLSQVSLTNTVLCEKEELPSLIAGRELEVLLTLGAGDIDREVPRLKKALQGITDTERTEQ